MRLLLVFLAAVLGVSHAGVCPKYPIIRDFDFHRYMGLWFQQDKLQASWEAPGRCWKTLYSRDRKNGQFKMRMIFSSTITGRVEEYDSQLTLQNPGKPSIIKYTIPLTFMEDEFQVLATDYESFAIEYKCDPNGLLEKLESIWLLTRDKNPTPLVLQRAYAIMHRLGVDIRKLERVDQTCGGLEIADYGDYDYYSNPQFVDNNRRYQQQNNDYYQYQDYYYQADGQQEAQQEGSTHQQSAASSGVATQQQPSPANYHPVSYPPQSSDSAGYRRRSQARKKINLKRQQSVPNDDRITLGQSLATRLWHVLHTPVKK
ncbi:apolipoprotein D-like isoform X1 [Macrobrachium rosenbergii]|uniref:apolipoprotein D-like isoform X1 n=3 Tax=Macrobrachium rosenbergii TaxID=79674 RepID=UPI0034D46D04